ncbi:T9SS type A sorting domain-containing protein [Roseimarinus sediminis]|uniref:T9SS type A sorting domain-containing protein n=1 Tax=Roseimarinus sediminis TaxID=1610899 RepID=UPI003D1E5B5A
MTSILAIIISAVLFWPPKNVDKTASDETAFSQAANTVTTAVSEEKKGIDAYEEQKETNNRETAISKPETAQTEEKVKTELTESSPSFLQIENNEASKGNSAPVNLQKTTQQHPDNIKTIKGDLKMLIADKELLKKLGFQFIKYNTVQNGQDDERTMHSLFYQNKTENGVLTSLFHEISMEEEKEVGTRTSSLNNSYTTDRVSTTRNNYYPVIQSFYFGENISDIIDIDYDLEMANDTLFPVFVPEGILNRDPNNTILWFTVTEEFVSLLPAEVQKQASHINHFRTIKQQYPEFNLIDYTQPTLIDSSKFINLSWKELKQLGFEITYDSTLFEDIDGYVNAKLLRFFQRDTNSVREIEFSSSGRVITSFPPDYKKQEIPTNKLSFVTHISGDFQYNFTDGSIHQVENLVPVIIKKDSLPDVLNKDLIFWYQPSDYLFQNLPAAISKKLQAEYNYIMTENKSKLVKPECNYFEECRNTLRVNNFKVFPNPAANAATVTFDLPFSIDGRITLIDLAGRERMILQSQTQLAAGHHRFDLNLDKVQEGIYLIALYSESGIQVKRLIISK